MTLQPIKESIEQVAKTDPPVKRAAYSDRTAWLMAIMSELAYLKFDEESKCYITNVVEELINLTSMNPNEEKLEKTIQDYVQKLTKYKVSNSSSGLSTILDAGGFKLAKGSPIHISKTDTQAFVALPKDEKITNMAIIVFRGTTNVQDWMTNLEITAEVIKDCNGEIIGKFHKGFHDAYKSVEADIQDQLEGYTHLPLYITGHSLGGALAVICTWYHNKGTLGACYTFGAPRVGDETIMDKFRTPIYRIVNAADPVPFVPPAGKTISLLKTLMRTLSSLLPFSDFFIWITQKLVKIQKFRHIGYMRYLSFAEPDHSGNYPALRVEFAVSSLDRLIRYGRILIKGKQHRIDKYHDIRRYRDKLRYWALTRNK